MVPREGFGWMNGERSWRVHSQPGLANGTILAAYQVGLSFLSTGMRRAVSACTSPEVVFGAAANQQPINAPAYSVATNDPLDLAMEHLQLSAPQDAPHQTAA